MTNFQIDLLQEALLITLKDKYAMPNNMHDFVEKYERIVETWEKLEAMRKEEV